MGTHMRVLSESFLKLIPTWHGLDGFQKYLGRNVLWMNYALEGLNMTYRVPP